jgi:hypothetical protein
VPRRLWAAKVARADTGDKTLEEGFQISRDVAGLDLPLHDRDRGKRTDAAGDGGKLISKCVLHLPGDVRDKH